MYEGERKPKIGGLGRNGRRGSDNTGSRVRWSSFVSYLLCDPEKVSFSLGVLISIIKWA